MAFFCLVICFFWNDEDRFSENRYQESSTRNEINESQSTGSSFNQSTNSSQRTTPVTSRNEKFTCNSKILFNILKNKKYKNIIYIILIIIIILIIYKQ